MTAIANSFARQCMALYAVSHVLCVASVVLVHMEPQLELMSELLHTDFAWANQDSHDAL